MRLPFLPFLVATCAGCYNYGDKVLAEGDQASGGTGFNVGGAASASGGNGTTNGGGSSTSLNELNMLAMTQDKWDEINADACKGWTAEGEMVPADVLFIVDTSGSMKQISRNTTDGRSKWEITQTALQNALDGLPSLTSVGMLLWPNMRTVPNNNTNCAYCNPDGTPNPDDVGECVNISAMVPLAQLGPVGAGQRTLLTQALEAVTPQGGTPMADAYNYAVTQTYGDPLMIGKKFAVLITDGQPTIQLGCMGTGEEEYPVDFQPVMSSIAGALQNKPYVKTFVIGSPGSEAQSLTGTDGRNTLSEAAREGGTPLTADCSNSGTPNYCHFDMSDATDFAAGFTDALRNITGQVLPCSYQIDDSQLQDATVDPDRINVIYQINGSPDLDQMRLVGKAADSSCPDINGWFLDPTDSTGKTIQLCPTTCDLIHSDAGAVINIRGGCKVIPIIG